MSCNAYDNDLDAADDDKSVLLFSGGERDKVEDQGKEGKRTKEDQIIPRCVNFVDQICNNYKTKQDIKKYIPKNNQ